MITVSNLSKSFRSGHTKVDAVTRLSFYVQPAEVYGLLGPNGAGKTTTIRMMLGLLRPDQGFAEIDGFRSTNEVELLKSRIGLVSANDGVYPWLTVREVLLFFADIYGVDVKTATDNLRDISRLLDIGEYLDRRCIALSTGQKQRVSLARALIHDPPVMLLDEPTRGLDVIGTQVVFEYINHLRSQGKAVIVCTHRLDEAERLCDRFGLLHRGNLLHEGSLEQLRASTGCNTLVDIFLQHLSPSSGQTGDQVHTGAEWK